VLTLSELRRLPSISRIVFLECSANNPFSWDPGKPEHTAQYLVGLTSCSLWTGVPVKTLLREVGVRPGATWVLAEGADAPVMTRSIPIEKLMDDAMIAYGQNGEPLRPAQGFPARLLRPGWEGNTNVKWLRRLEFADQPFMHKEETGSYTDPMPDGKVRQFTFVMECRSVITQPSGGHALPARGFWEIRGLAWSGRGRITKVEVSTDAGKTWGAAALDQPVLAMAHTRFRFPWNWDGREAILESRATDESGYVQPTRQQLEAVRGKASVYHYNGIQRWRVGSDGKVTNSNA
jgi:sulfane dehydrogenase subunit SoxC